MVHKYLESIKTNLANDSGVPVHTIVVPGNHDCNFSQGQSVRNMVVEKIASDSTKIDEDVIKACTSVQKEFFDFQNIICEVTPVFEHALWREYEINIKGKCIRVSAINASWMSTKNESQGKLVFPIGMFQDEISAPSNIRIALLHHPLNWYNQESYHPLKNVLRTHADIVMSGHEHTEGSGSINDTSNGKIIYFEAPALMPHSPSENGAFISLLIDLDEKEIIEKRVSLFPNDGTVVAAKESHIFSPAVSSDKGMFELNEKFSCFLRDPGGNFSHPAKDKIQFEDIFQYPEVEVKSSSDMDTNIVSSERIILSDIDGARVIYSGEEKSGKTFLLLRSFIDFHSSGYAPLYIKYNDIKNTSQSDIEKAISNIVAKQYKNPRDFETAERKKRIVLIDDIDQLRGGVKALGSTFKYLESNFNSIFATASTSFEIEELVDVGISEVLGLYDLYEIREFGHNLRHKLIKKWCLCGDITTRKQLDEKVHEVESLITSVLGRNLIPRRPIYLLILLQSSETRQQTELQNSSFSYYYQFLITKSLGESGVRPDHFNELFNYISHLAWFFKSSGNKEINKENLRGFNDVFSKKFVTVDLDPRIKLLCESKIITECSDYYSFSYPYIYYFFVGKYLADHLNDTEIKSEVVRYCQALNKRENANSILFLCHHRNDSWVIDQISEALENCLPDTIPIKFEKDIDSLNSLVNSASQLTISDLDVEANQEESRQMVDNAERSPGNDEDEDEDEQGELVSKFSKVGLLIKTSEIMGRVLKNYYGSIERERKRKYLVQVFDGPMRSLSSLIENIVANPNALISEIESILSKKHKNMSDGQKKDVARKISFHLVGMVCTGFVGRTAEFVATDKLREDISSIVEETNINSYRLIDAATYLIQPGALPFDKIKRISIDFKHNIFAFTILQTLAYYHLHMFHTTFEDKQKLGEYLNISMNAARKVDLKSRNRKLK